MDSHARIGRGSFFSAGQVQQVELEMLAALGDEGDLRTVRRPDRGGIVIFILGKLLNVAAVASML